MADLRKRFGRFVALHRQRRGWTQERLAEAAAIRTDMVAKIEAGGSGARFPTIERLAAALEVDPAELFTGDLPAGAKRTPKAEEIMSRLTGRSEGELGWLLGIVDAAIKPVKREK